MLKGVLLALTACFIWGLIFIIPVYMTTFDSFEIALGRHGMFGLVSLGILAYYMFYQKKRYSREIWKTALLFALVANIVYYTCLVLGVKFASPGVAALIMGVAPVLIAFYGNRVEKDSDFKKPIFSCLAIIFGLGLIHFPDAHADFSDFDLLYLFGILGSVVAVLAWCWYVVMNMQFLKKYPDLHPAEWATVMGASTFVWVLLLGILYEGYLSSENFEKFSLDRPETATFLAGCAVLGVLCSWVGSYLWNRACRMIPIALAGQLSVFETIFGLLFFYAIERRIPPLTEISGILIILVAVVYAVRKSTPESVHPIAA